MAMHYGVYYDETKPTTGVVNSNAVEWLGDEIAEGINLSYEDAEQFWRQEFANDHGIDEDEVEEHDAWDHYLQSCADGYYEENDTYLIGSWKKDDEGQYMPDPDAEGAEYAAIVREFVVQVVWSTRVVKVRSMCSLCYPGQADLDSGEGEILAYALPLDVMGNNE